MASISAMPSTPRRSPRVGTRLKRLLRFVGIKTGNCGCDEMAARMDAEGCDWCREHADAIVRQMKEEARRRHLPFSRWMAGRVLAAAIRLECPIATASRAAGP